MVSVKQPVGLGELSEWLHYAALTLINWNTRLALQISLLGAQSSLPKLRKTLAQLIDLMLNG